MSIEQLFRIVLILDLNKHSKSLAHLAVEVTNHAAVTLLCPQIRLPAVLHGVSNRLHTLSLNRDGELYSPGVHFIEIV